MSEDSGIFNEKQCFLKLDCFMIFLFPKTKQLSRAENEYYNCLWSVQNFNIARKSEA